MRTEEMMLNVGPQHPSTHGILRLVVNIEGEQIINVDPVIGYLHRGTEKLAEDLSYMQIIPYTDRMDYISAMTNNYVLVHAVEELMNIEIPPLAQYMRVIVMEMNRIASHLLWMGTYLLDLGALSPFLYAFKDREYILSLFNELCGARLTYSYMRIGGVKWKAPDGWIDKLCEFMEKMKVSFGEYRQLIDNNIIFKQRTQGLGSYTKEEAIAYGLSGSNLRVTGVDFDLRKDRPYALYDDLDFEVPLGKTNDIYGKYLCRMHEAEISLGILEQLIKKFPGDGPFMAKVPRILRAPEGEIYVSIESPRGELGCYIISKGRDKPWRIKFRRPSFYNLQILPHLLKGENLSNLVAILGSIDIVLGEVDG